MQLWPHHQCMPRPCVQAMAAAEKAGLDVPGRQDKVLANLLSVAGSTHDLPSQAQQGFAAVLADLVYVPSSTLLAPETACLLSALLKDRLHMLLVENGGTDYLRVRGHAELAGCSVLRLDWVAGLPDGLPAMPHEEAPG